MIFLDILDSYAIMKHAVLQIDRFLEKGEKNAKKTSNPSQQWHT
jgi:hypothetical protein